MKHARIYVFALALFGFFMTHGDHPLCAAENVIVLAHEISWAPHYGKDLEGGGYTVEIVREALKRVGYTLETVWLPWKRAQVEAARGVYDGLGASYLTEERAKAFAPSDPVAATEVVFFKRKKDDVPYSKLEDLKPYKIGTGFGYGYPAPFLKADYLQKVPAYELKTNIHRLLNKRIDLIIGSRDAILFYLKENYPDKMDDLAILGDPMEVLSLYVLFSKAKPGYEEKLKAFNQGLGMIKQDGTYEAILKEHGLEER